MNVKLSRIERFRTPHRISVIRKQDKTEKVLGRVREDCSDLILYENVPARITVLREFTENILRPADYGNDSGNIYRIMMVPRYLPQKILRGDFVRIPWGTKPNYYVNPFATLGPQLWISTPIGNKLLTWDNDREEYNEDPDIHAFRLYYTTAWFLEGPGIVDEFEFSETPSCNATWPAGYDFLKVTGPPIDYEILRFEHALDELGGYHHTRAEIEARDYDWRKGV